MHAMMPWFAASDGLTVTASAAPPEINSAKAQLESSYFWQQLNPNLTYPENRLSWSFCGFPRGCLFNDTSKILATIMLTQ